MKKINTSNDKNNFMHLLYQLINNNFVKKKIVQIIIKVCESIGSNKITNCEEA